ncbi:MAG: MraY family glycosyltransferase [Coriobacteriales bacterium]|nr:MraY family glycosyltransferase [Coriobacteriales bacterium]
MLSWWLPFVVLFATSLVATLMLTPLARRIAWKVGAIDYPSARRVNTHPTPRMGGIAVFCGLIVGELVQVLGTNLWNWPVVLSPSSHGSVNFPYVFASFGIIFLTGLLDDKFQLKPLQKLVGQTVAACVAAAGGMSIDVIVNPATNDAINLGILAFPITVVYLVAYTNIFNLIDGLDGLASGIAFIASLTMWVVSTISGHLDAAALSIMLAGATLGFLRYNFHPASIFLGDSGSLLIGFALGSVSLLSVSRVAGLTAIIIPLVVAGIPIIDTFSAIVRRGRAHVSIGHADKGHIHHRLLNEGFDQRQTVLVIYAWTALLCLGAILMTQVRVVPRIIIFFVLIIASAIIAARLQLFRPVLLHHYDPKTGEDELVCPQDPEFKEEEKRQVEHHDQQ